MYINNLQTIFKLGINEYSEFKMSLMGQNIIFSFCFTFQFFEILKQAKFYLSKLLKGNVHNLSSICYKHNYLYFIK